MIKKRWLVEALTWKISSTLLGLACVLWAAGAWKVSLLYIATYFPLSTIWYVIHKKLWSNWKRKQYEKAEAAEEEESYDEC